MRLSLCIATYNEEKFIHYPLDSGYDLVDEVVIVDGGSTDRTVELAKSYGKKVRVYIEDNPQMFHINKQKAISRARGEWILQLDADEALSDELRQEIVKLLNGSITKKNNNETMKQFNNIAYWVPRKNFFLTRFLMKGGQYPDYTIRLYRNGVARFPCKSVHENVEIISNIKDQKSNIQIKKNNGTIKQWNNQTIGYLKNPILHFADPDFSRYLTRWNRYTTLDAELLSKKLQVTNYKLNAWMFPDYFMIKPAFWFLNTYVRHKGFLDGFPGFVFALFSSLRFWVIYIKLWKLTSETN